MTDEITTTAPADGDLTARYEQAVTALAVASDLLPAESALACLRLRDALARELGDDEASDLDVGRIVEADRVLSRLDGRLATVIALADYRRTLVPSPEAWWWHSEQRRDERWRAWSLVLSAFTVALVLEIARRFGPGGLDVTGLVVVLLPAVLAALSAGGALSNTVAERLGVLLDHFNMPAHRRRFVGPGLAASIFLVVVGLYLALPWVSGHYNNKGYAALKGDRLAAAESYLKLALRLDGDNAQARYNLGDLYERLAEPKAAIREYRMAVAAGLDVAANNLGRLLVLEDRPDDAVAVLLPLERRTRGDAVEPDVRYRILKNLGWARVAQGRPADALAHLEAARQLVPGDAPAHCLLGRAYAKLGDMEEAVKSWDACLARARDLDPDEDRWIGEADAFRAETGR